MFADELSAPADCVKILLDDIRKRPTRSVVILDGDETVQPDQVQHDAQATEAAQA
jgi:hypothetical protein